MMTIYTFVFVSAFVLCYQTAFLVNAQIVPQVALCDYVGCPLVSRIGLGTLHLGDSVSGISKVEDINSWISSAVNIGINLFDLADVYPVKGGDAGDSATLFGQALEMTPGLREKIVIVAKMGIVFPSTVDTSISHLSETLNWYLTALGTNYVDIVLLHYPSSFTNASAVASLFATWKESELVKNFGVSNHYPSSRKVLQSKLDSFGIKLVTNEVEVSAWNPGYLNYDSSIVDDAYISGFRVLGWSAMGGDPVGGLNRLFVRNGQRQRQILRALGDVATQLGRGNNETDVTALAWVLSHPSGIIPLLGSTKIDRVRYLASEAFSISGNFTPEMWWKIGGAGGLCAYADSQCNYDLYKA